MEAVEVGDMEEVLHPLLIPLILRQIFKGSSLQDLKEYRQVCRTWRESTSEAMTASTKVEFRYRKSVRIIYEFLEDVVQDEDSHFSAAPFVSSFVMVDKGVDIPEFWDLCGGQIKSLELYYSIFDSAHHFRHAIFQSCPNLEELFLYQCEIEGHSDDEIDPDQFPANPNLKILKLRSWDGLIGWDEMFTQFPSVEVLDNVQMMNFQVLDMYDEHDDTGLDCNQLFTTLDNVQRQHNRQWSLKELRFSYGRLDEPQKIVPIIANGNIPLERLTMQYVLPKDTAGVRRILEAHAANLKCLTLVNGQGWTEEYVNGQTLIPLRTNKVFEKLEVLTYKFPVESMNFLRFVPALKKLVLELQPVAMIRCTSAEMDDYELSSCTELVWDQSIIELESQDVERLGKWLPNLEKLTLNRLNNQTFAKVCEVWPNLVSLQVTWGEVDDPGISGLDEEDVERINQEEGAAGFQRPNTVPRANVTGFKYLQNLSIQVLNRGLGYCAVAYGIQQLPSLKKLGVLDNYQNKLEGSMWDQLHSQFPLEGPF